MFSSSKSSTRSPLPPERAAPSDTNAEVLASIAGSVILRLRAIRLVADVFQADRAAAPIYQMVKWEHANAPLRLPADLRAFYYDHTDGVDVQWRVRPGASIEQILVDPTAAHSYPIGQMHLNSIAQLTPLPPTAILDAQGRVHPSLLPSDVPPEVRSSLRITAFDLDVSCEHGSVCLVYHVHEGDAESSSRPQVWFRDGSGDWWYVAASFADYFRLLVTYLGLPRWQCAYTEAGLDPVALQWFRLLAPDRLKLALEAHEVARARAEERSENSANYKPKPPGAEPTGAPAGESSSGSAGPAETIAAARRRVANYASREDAVHAIRHTPAAQSSSRSVPRPAPKTAAGRVRGARWGSVDVAGAAEWLKKRTAVPVSQKGPSATDPPNRPRSAAKGQSRAAKASAELRMGTPRGGGHDGRGGPSALTGQNYYQAWTKAPVGGAVRGGRP